MRVDVRVYVVTDPSYDGLPDIVAAAVAGGATCVQVRDKREGAERSGLVRCLVDVTPPGVTVIANDDLDAAGHGHGLHVGRSDVDPSAARSVLGPGAVIGWSIEDLAQLDDEAQLAACDYVAASPVWATSTKPDTGTPWGIDGVSRIADRLAGRLPLVAIGGIDDSNAADVIAAGADGIAVVSAVCGAPDPEDAARRLRGIVDVALAARGVVR